MEYIVTFIAAAAIECSSVMYHRQLSRDKDSSAIFWSIVNSMLAWAVIIWVVSDTQLFPAAIAGEVLVTTFGTRQTHRRLA
jgi:hypothetical protein